jgi:hypothetical protein
VQALHAVSQTKHELGAVPDKYLPAGQLIHPVTPAKEHDVGQLASQLEAQCP